jgi:hypothetical protein
MAVHLPDDLVKEMLDHGISFGDAWFCKVLQLQQEKRGTVAI